MSTNLKTRMLGLSAQQRREMAEAKRVANQEARDRWDEDEFHKEVAADMTEAVNFGFQHENLLELLVETEFVDENDRIFIEETRGLQVYWVSRGGTIDQSRLTSEVWELTEDLVGFHVDESEDKMRANFVDQQAKVIDLAITQMDAEINDRVLKLWQEAIPDSSSDYYVSGSGVSLTALDAAIREVGDETLEENPVIVGRRTMVDQIGDELEGSSLFLPETNERLIQLGVLGQYRGCQIIKLKNFKDQWNQSFFPANEMYVAGRDAGKFGFWGDLRAWEWVEDGGGNWHYKGRRSCGGAVHKPERVRRIVDTSQAA